MLIGIALNSSFIINFDFEFIAKNICGYIEHCTQFQSHT